MRCIDIHYIIIYIHGCIGIKINTFTFLFVLDFPSLCLPANICHIIFFLQLRRGQNLNNMEVKRYTGISILKTVWEKKKIGKN